MELDPDNIVIQLCAEGMEVEGTPDKAMELFQRAWQAATNDFEAFIAAHYIARHQHSPEDTLKWNLEALNRALAVGEGEVEQHLPSLCLNVGKSYEDLGQLSNAAEIYHRASAYAAGLPGDGYGAMISRGIEQGLKRVGVLSGECEI